MRRRDVIRGVATATALGAGLTVGTPVSAHEGGGDGDGTVVGEPEPYEPLGVVDVPGATEAVVSGRTVYVATGDGYATVDVSDPTVPRVLARRRNLLADRDDGPLVNVQDVKVDGDTLVVAGPAHPRRNALSGLVVVDVSDPASPVERGFFETDYPIHNCDVVDGRAYLTGNDGERNALVIVDVSDAGSDDPVELGRWSLLDVDDGWGDVEGNRRTLHDVTVHDGVAVCAHWDAGTWLVDVADPAEPRVLGSVEVPEPGDLSTAGPKPAVTAPGNHHYATRSDGLLAVGKETFGVRVDDDGDGEGDRTVGGPGGVDLWDVSDPRDPVRRATVAPPTSDDPTVGGTWTTAHNLDLAGGTLYTSWYRGGVKRHDVTDPANPIEESWWLAPAEASFWTARAARTDGERGVATPGFFVASSRGVGDVPGRLYTFPDRPGDQTEQPTLGSTTTATAAANAGETPSSSAASTESAASAPGFGVGSVIAALGAGGWWLRRRTGDRNP
jgi:hypothetical protein